MFLSLPFPNLEHWELGVEIKNMDIVCHDLPPQSPVEGLLGLNFLKKAKVIIDFSKNTIDLP